MRRSTLALLLLFAGCTWSDLDAEFLAALPQKADLEASAPGASTAKQSLNGDLGSLKSALQDTTLSTLDTQAQGINKLVDALAGGLDTVRQQQPTVRQTDSRTWGPYPDNAHPGLELEVVIVRGVDAYTYAVQWRAKGPSVDFTPVITGNFVGEKAKGGSGEFTLDLDKGRSIGMADDSGNSKVTLTYQNGPTGSELWLVVVPVAGSLSKGGSYQYSKAADGSGAMTFEAETTLTDAASAPIITLSVSAKWTASHAGALSAVATYDLFGQPQEIGRYGDCWSATMGTEFWSKDYLDAKNDPVCAAPPCSGPVAGASVANCTVPPP
jgi:hypothetical protein